MTSSTRRARGAARLEPVTALAAGGMGTIEVVLRREGTFRRLYARKRPQPALRRDPDVVRLFVEEGRLAGLIQHAHVVGVLDVGEDEDGPYLLMEYVDAVSAATLIQNLAPTGRSLPVIVAVTIAAQAARGLHAAHELCGPNGRPLDLVHRDVSPQNILVGFDGVVRVTDFGIAKAIGAANRTSTGLLRGNVGYMAPERLSFRAADRRSDLFSLGVVLYELLAGQRLYREGEVDDTARRILDEPQPDVGELRPDLPPELGGLLFELLAKDPADRPATALEVAQRLEALLAGLETDGDRFDLAAYLQLTLGHVRAARADAVAEGMARADAAVHPPRRRWGHIAAFGGGSVIAAGVLLALFGTPIRSPDVAVWGGVWHTCATRAGDLFCWGKNNEGQLGDGTTQSRPIRTRVSGVNDIVAAAGGTFHTCAIRTSGRVACWGRNAEGQLGVEAPAASLSPVIVPGLADVRALATTNEFNCALRLDGTVSCWGDNHDGQLGVTASPRRARPDKVPGLADVVDVSAGGHTVCARLRSGHVACFGLNDLGQLGDGTTEVRVGPVLVRGLEDATAIKVGSKFACAIRRGGDVLCWGDNEDGQIAQPLGVLSSAVPLPVDGIADAVALAALGGAACAVVRGGRVLCWGRGDWGSLGDGRTGVRLVRQRPAPVLGLTDAISLAAGAVHVCALHRDRAVSCWGDNDNGQIGDGSLDKRSTPVSVSGIP